MELPSGHSCETRMNAADAAIAPQEEGGREGVQVHGLGEFGLELFDFARQQHRVLDAVPFDKGLQARGVLQLIGLFKGKSHDLETAAVVLAIQLLEERGFVVTVRAPASADRDDHDLVPESGVAIGEYVAIQVG